MAPPLRLEEVFAGRSRCWGLVEDRFGTLRRQFVIDLDGRWDGRVLTLAERFRYDDGESGGRDWTIRPLDDGVYEGRATDVVGVARGRVAGNHFQWRYTMDLAVRSTVWRVRFDDQLILLPDGVLLSRARMSRWGVTLGSVTATFRRVDGEAPAVAG